LSEENGADEALQSLHQSGMTVGPNQILTGWWHCRDEMVTYLENAKAPLLGVTGGFVTSGAWIDALAATQVIGRGRAFLATRMTDAELAKFRGYVPRINQTGTYIGI